MKGENLVYPGRFQPLTLGHVECLNKIYRENKPERVVLAFPENMVRSFENPFLAEETKKIIELSCKNFLAIEAMGVRMEGNLYELWKRYMCQFQIDVVASGNEGMVALINKIGRGKTRAISLNDNSGGIRATEVREKLMARDPGWKKLMVPEATEYIDSLDINWEQLPKKRKRWYL